MSSFANIAPHLLERHCLCAGLAFSITFYVAAMGTAKGNTVECHLSEFFGAADITSKQAHRFSVYIREASTGKQSA